jgi:hypothetical protein
MPIRLECCNAHVILNRSPCGRRFFAHRNQPPECNWKPESIEHIELKAVVDDAVNATPGWSAEQEKLGPNWQADVLAIRGKMKIAFEIQVSGQGQLKTALREDRYETADVLPWWLVTARNAGDGFGSQLRTQLRGTSLEEKCRSAERAVPEILRRVESQVRIAEAIVLHLRAKGVPYRLTKFCNVPVLFELEVGGKTRQSLWANSAPIPFRATWNCASDLLTNRGEQWSSSSGTPNGWPDLDLRPFLSSGIRLGRSRPSLTDFCEALRFGEGASTTISSKRR